MGYRRSNRARTYEAGNRLPKIGRDEKLVGFRISSKNYDALASIAESDGKPIALLINEALERCYKLAEKARGQ